MEIKKLKKMLKVDRCYLPFMIFGDREIFIKEIIELKEKMAEAEKVIINLSIEVKEHINK